MIRNSVLCLSVGQVWLYTRQAVTSAGPAAAKKPRLAGLGCSLLPTGAEGRTDCSPVTVTALPNRQPPPAQLRRLHQPGETGSVSDQWFLCISNLLHCAQCKTDCSPCCSRSGSLQAGKVVAPPLLSYVELVSNKPPLTSLTDQLSNQHETSTYHPTGNGSGRRYLLPKSHIHTASTLAVLHFLPCSQLTAGEYYAVVESDSTSPV